MFKTFITLLFLSLSAQAFVAPSEHIRKSKWDISPIQIQFMSAFFALELITYSIISPSFVKTDFEGGDYDYNEDDLSVPTWLYELGNHGPELLTAGMYGYYLFGRDEYALEKAFVFTESLLISQGITFGIKYSANKERPDSSNYLSFPSGHTTHAFAVGMWMSKDIFNSKRFHRNYLLASLPLVYATYIGWSRIDAKKHSFRDVSMGAFIGGLTSYLMYDFHFDENGCYRFNKKSKIVIAPSLDIINERYALSFGMML